MSRHRRPKEKYQKKQPHFSQTLIAEVWAIIFILISLFIFISIQFPNSTGLIGYWIIEIFARTLVGKAIHFLPTFFLMYAVTYIFFKGNQRWKITLPSFIIAFLSFTILMELYTFGPIQHLPWPISTTGGGILGTMGLYLLQKTVGVYGTFICLFGLLTISILLCFDCSIIDFVKYLQQRNELANQNKFDYALKNSKENPTEIGKITQKKKPTFWNWIFGYFLHKKQPLPPTINSEETNDEEDFTPPNTIALSPKEVEQFNQELDQVSKKLFQEPPHPTYQLPPISLLDKNSTQLPPSKSKEFQQELAKQAKLLEETLLSFGVQAEVINITPGPSVTRFELKPGTGVKISKITALSKDIALKLAATDVRIEAPIPGKALIGIEVPNPKVETVTLRSVFEKTDFMKLTSKLVCGLGLTISGDVILMDLAKMPHVLIAGATGSGKSVCINSIILSILLRATPDEVKFVMIDPKKVELSLYEGIPHLLAPVVTNPNKAAATLKRWALLEMDRRYELFSNIGTKNIEGYNEKIEELTKLYQKNPTQAIQKLKNLCGETLSEIPDSELQIPLKLPYIVVVIDELADLMMVAAQDVEQTICRLAQMARATGIHLVIATQRPSVNVITGLIKANIPTRISFFLQSQIDSRTILDMPGAEKLLGKGDMLYSPVGSFKPLRIQGVYISEKEVKTVVDFLKKQGTPNYLKEIIDVEPLDESGNQSKEDEYMQDDLFNQAKDLIQNTQYASTSYLQRKLRIGYNRAARLMDELEEKGVVTRSPDGKIQAI